MRLLIEIFAGIGVIVTLLLIVALVKAIRMKSKPDDIENGM